MTSKMISSEPRSPSEASPARMQALSRLPVFFALAGKRVVVAGGNAAAAWKVELLAAAGAAVEVFAPQPCEELLEVAGDPPAGSVEIFQSEWHEAVLDGCAIAIGAFDDESEAARFLAACRVAGVPCNVIDKPEFCDFSFGAIVNRSPMVVAVSTDGAAPVFAQAVRSRIEAMLPAGFARLGACRAQLARRGEEKRPAVQRPPAVLAELHQTCPARPEQRADKRRLRATIAGNESASAGGRTGLGDAGRRRSRRSRIADAARRCARCNRPT